jgi:hypothetical protein
VVNLSSTFIAQVIVEMSDFTISFFHVFILLLLLLLLLLFSYTNFGHYIDPSSWRSHGDPTAPATNSEQPARLPTPRLPRTCFW